MSIEIPVRIRYRRDMTKRLLKAMLNLNHTCTYEPRHDKTSKMSVRPAKTQISLGVRPVWSESWLSAWRNLGSLATHWAHSEDSDQTGRMPRLICVFAGRTLILLVLSCRGSHFIYRWSSVIHMPVRRGVAGVRSHPLAVSNIKEACSFSLESEFTHLLLASKL